MTYAQAQMDAMNRGIEIGEAKGIRIGEARGEARGEAKGIMKTLVGLVKDGVISVRDASKRANMSEKEFAALIAVQ